jgi:hypothetical protein
LRKLQSLLPLAAMVLTSACQSAAQTVSSSQSACLLAQAPAGVMLVARVCDEDTAGRLFDAHTGAGAQSNILSSTSRPRTLSVPLPFDPHNGPFVLFKRTISNVTGSWEEYGVFVFDRALLVRSVLNCPIALTSSDPPLGLEVGPSVTSLTCPVGSGYFSEMVRTPATYLINPGLSSLSAGQELFKVTPSSPKVAPYGQLVFRYNMGSGAHTTTQLLKDYRGLTWYLGGP